MKTFVGREPCLIPQQETSYPELKHLYKLELTESRSKCDIQLENLPNEDPRYNQMSLFSTNEYAVQETSGVLTTLQGMERFSEFVPDIEVKKQAKYDFFWRPANDWTCTRAKMNEALKVMDTIDIENLH